MGASIGQLQCVGAGTTATPLFHVDWLVVDRCNGAGVPMGQIDLWCAVFSFSAAAGEANKGDRDSTAMAECSTSGGRALSESATGAVAHAYSGAKEVRPSTHAKGHRPWRTMRRSEIDTGVSEARIVFDRPARQALCAVKRDLIIEQVGVIAAPGRQL